MEIVCLDLEGVLIPEIWISLAERTGIEALRATTREVPDYDALMRQRLRILEEHGLGLPDVQAAADAVGPLEGAKEFMDWLRRGRMELLTQDHSWVGEEIRNKRLTPEEAEVHPHRSALLRSIGVDPEVEVDVKPVPVESGDRFLLCSDGLWGEVDEETIAVVMANDDPETSARRLVELANDNGGRDNVTVQMVVVPAGADTLPLPPMPRREPPPRGSGWGAGAISALVVGGLLVAALLWLALGSGP